MSNYLKKTLFTLLILVLPYMNSASKAMYEELIRDEIRITTKLSKVGPCVYATAQNYHGKSCAYDGSTPRANPSGLICSVHGINKIEELQTELEATKNALKPFREQQEYESKLRQLKLAQAEAKLKRLNEGK